ncbi:MAG: FAD-dependent oxidoreductase [Gammaproteobacteria bacterium]|nr:FAD-dependent oxidoreductase [Gammaproteobacteria bacterium]MBU1731508.1 FAD-dependent oxidoreductase [Gammaproteobacteria bacterium]MBU1893013.1 FAD-dependent oxidoreductase [Gammaproteobacteria bacterium]
MNKFDYVIVGGGLAGASAIQGIREHDSRGSILLIGEEMHPPYNRPPLSKALWFGKSKVEDIFIHPQRYYEEHGVTLALGARVSTLDSGEKSVTFGNGSVYRFGKLLLATGTRPRRIAIPGAEIDGINYFRTLDDYLGMQGDTQVNKSALIIGGGFIGSELAAALNINLEVTMIFPSATLCRRVFPEALGLEVQRHFQDRGIRVIPSDTAASISKKGSTFRTETVSGKSLESDLVIIGIGVEPCIELARDAGLEVGNGIVVNEFLESSHPDIYAAGDNAFSPYRALGKSMRIEHWDNALVQGRWAGGNMAGAHEAYTYQPYFFSDLFELGYEATGEVDTSLEVFADWQKENQTGVIYYLRDGRVRGVMMCNLWGKLDMARELIRKGAQMTPESLRGAIR